MIPEAVLAAFGTILFMLCARSWRDLHYLVYDGTTGVTSSMFIAQIVVQGIGGVTDAYWIARTAMVVALSVVTAGRIFRDWPVSGHLAFVLSIALVQLSNPELPWVERLLYTVPVPVVLAIRVKKLDHGHHTPTRAGVAVALLCAAAVIAVGRL